MRKMKRNTKAKQTNSKTLITLFLAIGLFIALIVSKQVQDSLLNKLSIVSAIGIDKGKNGFLASIQIYNPAANSKEGSAETGAYTYSATGRTIPEAIDKIHQKLSRTIFLDNTEVVVLGENLVKSQKLSTLTHYFMREANLPANIRFVVAKGIDAEKLLQIFTPVQKISGDRMEEMLTRKQDTWGNLINITSNKIKEVLVRNRADLTIPYITIKGNPSKGISKSNTEKAKPDAVIALEGLAVFRGEKLSYWLSSSESTLFALTQSKIRQTTLITECKKKDGYISWKNVQSKPDLKVINKNGVPSFLLQIDVKGKLSDVSCPMDTSTDHAIFALEREAERDLQKRVQKVVAKSQLKKTDILGLADVLYRKQPARWNSLKKNWNSVYPTAKIKTNVRLDLIDVGDISK